MTERIFVKEVFLGSHNWEDCSIKEVNFLKNEHHHNFGVYVECDVYHKNRELEFIRLRVQLKQIVDDLFSTKDGIIRFGSMSCEMIARKIKFELEECFNKRNWKVIVDEDGVQGGIIQ